MSNTTSDANDATTTRNPNVCTAQMLSTFRVYDEDITFKELLVGFPPLDTSHRFIRPRPRDNDRALKEVFRSMGINVKLALKAYKEKVEADRDRTPTRDEYDSVKNGKIRRFAELLQAENDPPPRIIKIVHPEGVSHKVAQCIVNVRSMIDINPTIDILWGFQIWINAAGGLRAAVHVVVVDADGEYLDVTDCPNEDSTLFVPSSKALSPYQQLVALRHPYSVLLGGVVGGMRAYVNKALAEERVVTNPEDLIMYLTDHGNTMVVPRYIECEAH